ncbi:MAG: Gram-negative bacterial TonB protein C-terminal [Verrucomicrobiota bacterium]|jgi:hypothetical protein
MRHFGFWLLALFLIVDLRPSQSADLPRFRPALPGTGPTALINQIDTGDLLKKGQKDGAIMFCCRIAKAGDIVWSKTYRPMPGSDMLKAEVEKALKKVKFFPAIYEHQPVDAIYYGTVSFAVLDGKPRLRILANQEPKELKGETDFIGPQPIIGGSSPFKGLHYPEQISVVMNGLGYLALKVDAEGNLRDLQVAGEEPALTPFGDAAAADFNKAKFIPAFRNGEPVESNITLPVYYEPEHEGEEASLFEQ